MKVRAMSYVREPALADDTSGVAPPPAPAPRVDGPSGQLGVATTAATEPAVSEGTAPPPTTPLDLGVEPLNA